MYILTTRFFLSDMQCSEHSFGTRQPTSLIVVPQVLIQQLRFEVGRDHYLEPWFGYGISVMHEQFNESVFKPQMCVTLDPCLDAAI